MSSIQGSSLETLITRWRFIDWTIVSVLKNLTAIGSSYKLFVSFLKRCLDKLYVLPVNMKNCMLAYKTNLIDSNFISTVKQKKHWSFAKY